MSIRRTTTASLLAAALFLGACSGMVGASDDDDAAPPAVTVPEFGPLDEFRVRIYGLRGDETRQEISAHFQAVRRMIENDIATCMAEQGFEFIPRDVIGGILIGNFADDEPTTPHGTREFAEIYGFGISNVPPQQQAVFPDDPPPDPNDALLEAMTETEREAWTLALQGTPAGEFVESPDVRGCLAVAWDNVPGVIDDAFTALDREINLGFPNMVEADPRIVALNSSWVTCMSEAGHQVPASPRDLNQSLWPEWDGVGFSATVEEVDGELIWVPSPATQAFRDREIALAVADWDCREGLDFDAARRVVELELQQVFVDRHFADLETWAQYEEARRARITSAD
ncbi:MAG: hypothetical protein FWG25_00320 [Promicromonosporaceae bacterium]|nr:hypothetical protein [Promicromonosporaceae bacterium]